MRLFPLFTVLVTVSVFCALAVPCASSSADTCSSGGGPDGTTCSASSGGSTSVPQLDILQDESVARLKELEQTSDSEGSLARTFMSPAFVKAQDMISDWLRDAGFTKVWIDALGSVHGRLVPSNPEAAKQPVLYIGSHFDTVLDAGSYDGTLGIIVPIAAAKAMLLARGGDLSSMRRPLEVVAWCDEEGVRFGSTFLGSRAVAGSFPMKWLDGAGSDGATLRQVLAEAGLINSAQEAEENIKAIAVKKEVAYGYVEVHIEQGPVLEKLDTAVGTVLGIAGQTRLVVSVAGTQGHAGTVPMSQRKDALAAAAEGVAAIESICKLFLKGKSESEEMLVCTVGSLNVWPGASNVIAGNASYTVDIRARRDSFREEVVTSVIKELENMCDKRGVECHIDRKHDAAAVDSETDMTNKLRAAVSAAAAEKGEKLGEEPIMVSGAGHDALAMAELCPISMLFVRCRGGISHNPLEHVEPSDIGASARVTMLYLESELF